MKVFYSINYHLKKLLCCETMQLKSRVDMFNDPAWKLCFKITEKNEKMTRGKNQLRG